MVGNAFTRKKAIEEPQIPPPIPHAANNGNFFLASPVGKTSFANVQNVRNRIVFDKYEIGYSITRIHEKFPLLNRSKIKIKIKIIMIDDAQIKRSLESSRPRLTSSIFLKNNSGSVNSNKPLTRYNFEIIDGPKVVTTRDKETFSPTIAPQKIRANIIVVWENLLINVVRKVLTDSIIVKIKKTGPIRIPFFNFLFVF
jgi:hypothetical protein